MMGGKNGVAGKIARLTVRSPCLFSPLCLRHMQTLSVKYTRLCYLEGIKNVK